MPPYTPCVGAQHGNQYAQRSEYAYCRKADGGIHQYGCRLRFKPAEQHKRKARVRHYIGRAEHRPRRNAYDKVLAAYMLPRLWPTMHLLRSVPSPYSVPMNSAVTMLVSTAAKNTYTKQLPSPVQLAALFTLSA